MANEIDAEYDPVEGVHILQEATYRKQVRSQPALTCENCKKRHGERGVNVKRCQGVCPAIFTWRSYYINLVHIIISVLDRWFLLERCRYQLICSTSNVQHLTSNPSVSISPMVRSRIWISLLFSSSHSLLLKPEGRVTKHNAEPSKPC